MRGVPPHAVPNFVAHQSRMKATLTKATPVMKSIDDVVQEVSAREAKTDDIFRKINARFPQR